VEEIVTMREPTQKTLDEHREYLHEIVRLKFWYVHFRLAHDPAASFSDVIRNRVDIFRKTDANPGMLNPSVCHFDAAPWLSMENAAQEIYKQEKNDAAAFERRAFAVFRPSLDARCERDYSDPSPLAGYQCGSLRHEKSLGKDGVTMGFHIANAVAPHSIFDDPEHLKSCFRQLLDISEKIYGAKRIATGTWLNSNPKWLKLFPAEWAENMGPEAADIHGHYGFWGQFITGRGTFNFKYGEILRKTGKLPFALRSSSCSIESMRAKCGRDC